MPAVFHGAKAYHDAVVNWNDQDDKVFPLNSEEFDTDGYHSTVTNNSRMTIPSGWAGYYWVSTSAYIHGDPYYDAPITVKKNGVVVRGAQVTPATTQPDTVGGVATISAVTHCAEGDYLEGNMYVDNNSLGGTFPVGHATFPGLQMSLTVVWLGA